MTTRFYNTYKYTTSPAAKYNTTSGLTPLRQRRKKKTIGTRQKGEISLQQLARILYILHTHIPNVSSVLWNVLRALGERIYCKILRVSRRRRTLP